MISPINEASSPVYFNHQSNLTQSNYQFSSSGSPQEKSENQPEIKTRAMQHSFTLMHQYSFASPLMKTSSMKPSRIVSLHSTARWKAHFEASKATSKLMVVEFTTPWCVPCRSMEPFIEDLAASYMDVEFIKIDADELLGVASEFQVQIMPTFVLIKNGLVVDKVTGVKQEELQTKIKQQISSSSSFSSFYY